MLVWGILLVVAISVVVAVVMIVVGLLVKMRCPSCGKRKIELDERQHIGGVDFSINGKLFVCTACHTELARFDSGPLLPRRAAREGAREPIPRARAVR
jgi:predicted RNA-binding Zn-ribbon protein involved in translation (DUF1610 family)